MGNKLQYTFYLASAIEHNPAIQISKEDWKIAIKKEFMYPEIGIYDPVEREAQKTGKPTDEVGKYISGLKQGGHWVLFLAEMAKIWWGRINAHKNKVEILLYLRNKFLIDGNELRDLDFWGDEEAVIRSNFIVTYMEKNVKTVGTIREIHDCYLFDIPVYLIIPDQTKTELNSTLLEMVINSGGEAFYNVKECANYIKNKYKIGV